LGLETIFGLPETRTRPSAETGICAFGVEANPYLHEKAEAALEEEEKALPFSTLLLPATLGCNLDLVLDGFFR